VSWQANDQYVGWSPLGGGGGKVPGGGYLFTSVDALGSTDLTAKVKTQTQLGSAVAGASPVNEVVDLDGVAVPAGPPVSMIERRLGQRLPRVEVDDLLPRGAMDREPRAEATTPADTAPTLEDVRRVGEQASREARALSARGGRLPSRLPMVRPAIERGLAPRRSAPAAPSAKDSSAAPGG
jgi:hypothetical protein